MESLAILSGLDGETERKGRYISVHSAYEAVVTQREVQLSAVRHALAHPVTSLTRPSVRDALRSMFGSMRIDLRDYKHQKQLYICIGRMLIAIDNAVYDRLPSNWSVLEDPEDVAQQTHAARRDA